MLEATTEAERGAKNHPRGQEQRWEEVAGFSSPHPAQDTWYEARHLTVYCCILLSLLQYQNKAHLKPCHSKLGSGWMDGCIITVDNHWQI